MADVIQIDLNKILKGTDFEKSRVVGVALSGGRDSVALCHALLTAGENIVAINVEHGIRGERSIADSDFVKDFCEKYGITLYSFSVDVPSYAKEYGYTIEQAARFLRYAKFEEAIESGLCDVIALAHHGGDQAETILMRILRGTGTAGLVGMKELRGRYVRPLLHYTRVDIDEYIKANGLSYVEDETNADETYTRNFLRGEIARIKARYKDLEKSFERLSKNADEIEEYVESVLPKIDVKDGEMLIKTVDCVNSFVLKRLVLKGAKALGVGQDVEEKHLEAVVALASGENGKMLNLAHGLVAVKDENGIVLFVSQGEILQIEKPFSFGCREDFGVNIEEIESISEAELKDGKALYIDVDKLPKGAVLRRRRDGDFIKKFGGGRKTLGDFLTDKKVALRTRDSLVVIAKQSEVFAVFGVDVSRVVKVDENSKNIAKLTIAKN